MTLFNVILIPLYSYLETYLKGLHPRYISFYEYTFEWALWQYYFGILPFSRWNTPDIRSICIFVQWYVYSLSHPAPHTSYPSSSSSCFPLHNHYMIWSYSDNNAFWLKYTELSLRPTCILAIPQVCNFWFHPIPEVIV